MTKFELDQSTAEYRQLALKMTGTAAGMAGALAVGVNGITSPIGLAMKVALNSAASKVGPNVAQYNERRKVVDLLKDLTFRPDKSFKYCTAAENTAADKGESGKTCEVTLNTVIERLEAAFQVMNRLRSCEQSVTSTRDEVKAQDLILNTKSEQFKADGAYGKELAAHEKQRAQLYQCNAAGRCEGDGEGHAFLNFNAKEIRPAERGESPLTTRIETVQLRYNAIIDYVNQNLGMSAMNNALATLDNVDTVGGGIWGTQGAAVSSASAQTSADGTVTGVDGGSLAAGNMWPFA